MPLKDVEIRALRPAETPFKKADEKGLYLEVFPNGSKLWRWKYRFAGKEKRLAFGAYPEVSLKDARMRRDDARAMLTSGTDPALERKREKLTAHISAANSFELVAAEYIETKMVGESRAPATITKARWFLELLVPAIASIQIFARRIARIEITPENYETNFVSTAWAGVKITRGYHST